MTAADPRPTPSVSSASVAAPRALASAADSALEHDRCGRDSNRRQRIPAPAGYAAGGGFGACLMRFLSGVPPERRGLGYVRKGGWSNRRGKPARACAPKGAAVPKVV